MAFTAPPPATTNPMFTPENLLKMSAAMFAAPTFAQGLGGATDALSTSMTAAKATQKEEDLRNQTAEMLAKNAPDIAENVRTGALTASDGLRLYYQQKKDAADAAKPDYVSVNGLIFDKNSKQWIAPPKDLTQSQVDAGYTVQYGVDEQGNVVPMQATKDGRLVKSEMPEGVKLQKEPFKFDAGTHFVLYDPVTRQPIGTIPKNVAEVEKQKVIGETDGKNTAAAPGDLQAGLNAKAKIEELRVDPNREWATGWSSVGNSVMATPGYDYQTKVDEAKAGAFLTAIQQLRGMGALSNAEGQTATAAITRMNTSTSEKEFLDALDDYEKIIDQGIAKAQGRLTNAQPDQAQQPAVATDGYNTTTTGIPWKKK